MDESITLEYDCFEVNDGLMDCWLVINGKRYYLEGFIAFPPFADLLSLVRALASNSLPHEFFWREENLAVQISATKAESDGNRFRLQIVRSNEVIVDADLDRLHAVESLLASLRAFSLDCTESGTEWGFPPFLIDDFERERVNGFEPDTHLERIQMAHFVFEHFDDSGKWTFLPIVTPSSRKENPSFHIWIDHQQAIYLQMGEGPRLWQFWFEFLEKSGRGELPTEVIFDCRKPLEECENELDYLVQDSYAIGLRAERVPQSDDFRLVSWRLSDNLPDQEPTMHGRLERKQFIRSFVKSYDEFISRDYPAYESGNLAGFDLRSLPLKNINKF